MKRKGTELGGGGDSSSNLAIAVPAWKCQQMTGCRQGGGWSLGGGNSDGCYSRHDMPAGSRGGGCVDSKYCRPRVITKDSLRSMGSCGGIDEGCRLQVDEDGARAVFGSVKPCGFTIVGPASSGICG